MKITYKKTILDEITDAIAKANADGTEIQSIEVSKYEWDRLLPFLSKAECDGSTTYINDVLVFCDYYPL